MTSTSVSTAEAFLKHCCCSATGREGKMWTGGQKLSNHKLPLQKETSAPTSPSPLWLTHYRMPAQKHTDTHTHTHTPTHPHTHTPTHTPSPPHTHTNTHTHTPTHSLTHSLTFL